MLQRIQTVYLLIIVALTVTMLFLPLAVLQIDGQFYLFDVVGVSIPGGDSEVVYTSWGLFALVALMALIALVTVFLYKKRVMQIRLSVFNALLMIGFYGVFFFLMNTIKGDLDVSSYSIKLALSFPLICLILDYLAIRNIGADEALVRSLDRLR